jgi:hypothetical protein
MINKIKSFVERNKNYFLVDFVMYLVIIVGVLICMLVII